MILKKDKALYIDNSNINKNFYMETLLELITNKIEK